jgi:predicted phosphoribosyltransferase
MNAMNAPFLDEAQATDVVTRAIEEIGGTRSVYRNPRMAFSQYSKRVVLVDGRSIEIRYGEISTPAIATVEGWVFQINDEDIELLIKPKPKKEV